MNSCSRCGEQAPAGSRFCPACGAPLAGAPAADERRKVVTVVFSDVVGSTALGERVDAETLRWAMQRWFRRMAAAVERHGGTVENYVGDAVMAVFGIPVVHEDDALRAVRAAALMRDEVAALRDELRRERGIVLTARIGVNTGEAVTGAAAAGGSFTAGDIVNVAARLEQSARPGEILLGRDTYRLVRHAVETAPVAPLTVKGKDAPLEAHRLLAVAAGAHGRPQRPHAPLVGRSAERRTLLAAFDKAIARRAGALCTVLGAAGAGKSRLVAESLAALQDSATVVAGRCLPYGDGAAAAPVVDALRSSGVFAHVAAEPDVAATRARDLLDPGGAPVPADEAQWALRRVVEAVARRRPLVLYVDDLHWAEPALLDLLEHLAGAVRDVPVLLVFTARPELLDTRPAWGAEIAGATTIALAPLADAQAAELLGHLLGPARLAADAGARILEVAGGNPLFVEEVVAMLLDDGLLDPATEAALLDPAAISVPPTIQALLAARLDRLDPAERTVIEAAAVEGKEFARATVEALAGDGAGEIGERLAALVRKALVVPAGARFRFGHQLIRDAAYEGMPKALRADLHERFAARLPADGSGEPHYELLGHHLERAVLLRRELGAAGDHTAALAARATASLSAAASRAAQRDDAAAASALLERAVALVEPDDAACGELLPALGAALFEAGRIGAARRVLDEAIARAPEPRQRARAQVERELLRLEAETSADPDESRRVMDAVLPVLERAGDERGQCRVWLMRGQLAWNEGRVGAAVADWRAAEERARRAGDQRALFEVLGWSATAAALGPTPVDEAIARCEAIAAVVRASPLATASTLNPLALLRTMRGDLERAERELGQAEEILRELGGLGGGVSHWVAYVQLLAGRPERAEAPLRAGMAALASMDDGSALATTTALLAQAVYEQGRLDEAAELCRVTERRAAAEDTLTQAIWRGVQAKVLARAGDSAAAIELARAGVAVLEPTDLLSNRGDAMLELAEVLRISERETESIGAARSGVALYELKGNSAAAARARRLAGDRTGGRG